MAEKPSGISGQDLKDLDSFAEKQSRASSFDELLKLPIPSVSRVGSYFMALIMLGTIGLLYFGKVNVIVQAAGFIRTVENTFQIEAQENGVVTRIMARPGDRLETGASILQLDSAEKGLNVEQLRSELKILEGQLDKYSRSLETADRILADPQSYLKAHERADLSGSLLSSFLKIRTTWLQLTHVREVQQNASQKRRLQIQKEIQLAREKITTLKHNRVLGFEEIQRNEKDLTRKQKMLDDFRKLTQEGYYSAMDLSREEDAFNAARQALENKKKALADTDLGIANERIRLNELAIKLEEGRSQFRQQEQETELAYQQALSEFRESHANLQEEHRKLQNKIVTTLGNLRISQEHVKKTVIRMPFTGYIGNMKITNIGQIITAGEVLTAAYPEGSPMEVLAEVPNKDIGLISKDTQVIVKVYAFAFKDFGTIPGQVERIIPNVSGQGGFLVLVGLAKQALDKDGRAYHLFPGLTVEADFIIHKIRIYQLIVKELRKSYSKYEIKPQAPQTPAKSTDRAYEPSK